MPTYDYECKDCKEVFEKFLSIKKSEEPQECEKCGSTNTAKMIGKPAAHFKGSGFYVNDYKKHEEKSLQDRVNHLAKD